MRPAFVLTGAVIAIVLVIAAPAHADIRPPTYSEEHPSQTRLLGAALACVFVAAGWMVFRFITNRAARWGVAILILILALITVSQYRKLFASPPRERWRVPNALTQQPATLGDADAKRVTGNRTQPVESRRPLRAEPCTPEC